MSAGITVRGNATAEELAVVMAVLRRDTSRAAPHRRHGGHSYDRWRAARLAALRAAGERECRGIHASG
jgi:hypothetical protein